MMDLDRIQELIAEIAKTGDKQTIRNICELLSEISRYKGKSEKGTRMEESVQIPRNIQDHVSLILEGEGKFVPKKTAVSESMKMSHAADILG